MIRHDTVISSGYTLPPQPILLTQQVEQYMMLYCTALCHSRARPWPTWPRIRLTAPPQTLDLPVLTTCVTFTYNFTARGIRSN